jgi:hypothetical protein
MKSRKDDSNESLREEMWMENGGTESFGYNLETNRHFRDQFIFDNAIKIIGGEMLTFDIFANVDLTKATQTSKKKFWLVNAKGNHYTSFNNGGYAYQNKPTPKGEQSRGEEEEIGMTCTLQALKTITQISSTGSRAVERGHVD